MLKNDFKDKQTFLMKNYINYLSNNYLPVNVHQLHSLYTWLVWVSLHSEVSLIFWIAVTLSLI